MDVRRRRLDAGVRRALLLDAAERVFAAMGADRARMDDVAKEAAVAVGLLYRHFESKDALLAAVMERRGDDFATRLRLRFDDLDARGVGADQFAVEGLRAWLEQVTGDVRTGRWIRREEPAPCERFRQSTRRFVTERIADAAPGAPPGLAPVVAAMLEASAEAAALANENGHGFDDDGLAEVVLRFCLGGLHELARLVDAPVAAQLAEALARGQSSRSR